MTGFNHDGGKCPVAGDVMVEAELANGIEGSTLARKLAWGRSYGVGTIIKYRVVNDKPASKKPSWDDAPEKANLLVCHKYGVWYWGSFKEAKINDSDDGWLGIGEGRWMACEGEIETNQNWRLAGI
jgi:hypothetical protein